MKLLYSLINIYYAIKHVAQWAWVHLTGGRKDKP